MILLSATSSSWPKSRRRRRPRPAEAGWTSPSSVFWPPLPSLSYVMELSPWSILPFTFSFDRLHVEQQRSVFTIIIITIISTNMNNKSKFRLVREIQRSVSLPSAQSLLPPSFRSWQDHRPHHLNNFHHHHYHPPHDHRNYYQPNRNDIHNDEKCSQWTLKRIHARISTGSPVEAGWSGLSTSSSLSSTSLSPSLLPKKYRYIICY